MSNLKLLKPKLQQISKGYAEVCFKETHRWGFVRTEEIVTWTDFENDEIHETTRWFAKVADEGGCSILYYGHHWCNVGRKTGYKTRKEAVNAVVEYISSIKEY